MMALLALSAALFPTLAMAEDPVFWLDPTSSWLQLPPGEDAATVTTSGPTGGSCDQLTWPVPITNHLNVFECSPEVMKTALPLTPNITTVTEGTSFQVPVGELASWRVTIRVTNTHPVALNCATVSDYFGAEFVVTSITVSQGTFTTELSGAAQKVHLSWDVGSLAPGASATLQCTASTKLNPAGRQEYTSPGTYQLNSGATFKYEFASGGRGSVSSGTIQVTAVSAPSGSVAVLSTAGLSISSLEVSSLKAEDGGASVPAGLPIAFTEEFQSISPAISLKPAQYGYPPGFEVPQNLRLEWRVVLTVRNTLGVPLQNLVVTEHFGAELDVDRTSVSVTPGLRADVPPGAPYSAVDIVRQGNEKLEWTISRLDSGQQAALSLTIVTREKNGKQAYTSCTPPPGPPNELNSGAVLKYRPAGHGQVSLEQPKVYVWVACGGYLRVSVDGKGYDFQIRKPGTFSAEPILITAYGNRRVALSFSGFADLATVPPEHPGTLPTFYGFGDGLDEVERTGWIPAAELNYRQFVTSPEQVGTNAAWRLWPKLVAQSARAGEYTDTGILTFTLVECEPHIEAPPEREGRWPLTLSGLKVPDLATQ